MTELLVGAVVDERYAILSQIGEGGMGVVYKAQHRELNRIVALKVLRTTIDQQPENLTRFRNEAQVLSCLKHPNIVSVYSIGLSSDNKPYIAMEILTGRSLAAMIAADGPQPYQKVLPLFSQICDALQHAHEQNIIHRDIKPSNLLLEKNENHQSPKVVDFGIAKVLAGPSDLTKTSMIVGSILYMSPQRCEGRAADARSDIYSLGCTLFETLAGRPPFRADSLVDLAAKHREKKPPAVNEICPDANIPQALQEVIDCCLNKQDSARYASMADLRDDLNRVARGAQPIHIPSPLPDAISHQKSVLNSRVISFLAALFVVLAVSLLSGYFLSLRNDDHPYSQLAQTDLASRANEIITESETLYSQSADYSRTMAVLKQGDELLPYLKSQPYWRALLLRRAGEINLYEADRFEHTDQKLCCQYAQDALPYLEQSITEFDRAYAEQSRNKDRQSSIAAEITAKREQYAYSLLMHAHQHLRQFDQACEAAEGTLRVSLRLQYPVAKSPAAHVRGAVEYLSTDYAQRKKQPERVLKAVLALRDFYRRQGSVDQNFVNQRLRNVIASIAKGNAATAARGKRLLWGQASDGDGLEKMSLEDQSLKDY